MFLNNLFAQLLSVFYSIVPNYALMIIFLTLLVMVAVTPLTLKGTRSMMMMQQLQPEMKKLQTKYKDDRQKLNEELMKFYKENNINPLGGCLPLLVQAPVFIVLYQVLKGLTRRDPAQGMFTGFNVGQLGINVPPVKAPNFVLQKPFDPAFLDQKSALWQSLHGSTTMTAFGIDLAESPAQALTRGVVAFLPYLVLILLVAASGFIQQRQIQGRTPQAQQANPQMQAVMKIMPLFLPVFSFTLPGGLVLYFVVSNLYRIGQQAFISKSIYGVSGLGFLLGFGSLDAKTGTASGAKPSSGGARGGSAKGAKSAGKGSSGKSAAKPAGRSGAGTKSGGSGASGSTATKERKRTPTSAPEGAADASPLQPRARKQKKR